MARIVITGGAGFIGSHICERFLAEGDEVICMDNFLTGSPDNIAHLLGNSKFTFIEQNVTTYLYVKGPVDAILHFASPASPIDYLELPIETLKVGSLGTHKALGLAKEKGARFLLASTSEVYGDPLVHPQPEDYWGRDGGGVSTGCDGNPAVEAGEIWGAGLERLERNKKAAIKRKKPIS